MTTTQVGTTLVTANNTCIKHYLYPVNHIQTKLMLLCIVEMQLNLNLNNHMPFVDTIFHHDTAYGPLQPRPSAS